MLCLRENNFLIPRCGLFDLASELGSMGSGVAFRVQVFRGWPRKPCTNTILKLDQVTAVPKKEQNGLLCYSIRWVVQDC